MTGQQSHHTEILQLYITSTFLQYLSLYIQITRISWQDKEDGMVGQGRGMTDFSANQGYVETLHFFNCFLRLSYLNFIL